MIWLDICDNQGNALYFDLHHIERRRAGRRWQHAISGICGNGLFEISVLVEPNEEGEVTYVDLSAGSYSGHQLLSGIDSSQLDHELLELARRQCGLETPAAERGPHQFRRTALYACEDNPDWQSTL